VAVKLYRSDTRTEDHYAPSDTGKHQFNFYRTRISNLVADSDLWEEISFVVDMSMIRPMLKKKLVKRRKAKPRQPPAELRRSGRLIGKYAESSLDRSLSQLSLQSGSGSSNTSHGSSSTRGSDTMLSASIADTAPTEHEDNEKCMGYYCNFFYEFRIVFEGLLAKYELKCPITHLVVEGESNMTPIYDPGTC
jgi:hypothetical protein